MPKHLMISIDWYGPYTLDTAYDASKEFGHGLYFCIGKQAYQRKRSAQYIGISSGKLRNRIKEDHDKLKLVVRERQIWLGEVSTAEPGGRKLKFTRATLDYAEWLHARFLQLGLNDKKTKSLPPRSVTVLNRWFQADYATPRQKRPHADWPDLIDYPDFDLPARTVWFGSPGKQRRFHSPGYGLE